MNTDGDPTRELTTTAVPAPTEAVAGATVPRRGGLRWALALGLSAVVVGVAAAAAFLLVGQGTDSKVLAYAPKDSVVYVELRLDLPGDQRAKLGSLLAHFPGFADQSTFDGKLDETLDKAIRAATKDAQDYTTKIKPWFGGELGISISKPAAVGGTAKGGLGGARGLVLVSVTDATKAAAWIRDTLGSHPVTSETYGGVELTIGDDSAVGIVDGKVMLAGDVASVKAAIDSKGTGGLSTTAGYRAAQAALAGADLGSVYVDTSAYGALLEDAIAALPSPVAGLDLGAMTDHLPAWIAVRVRSEGDALTLDAVAAHVAGTPGATNRDSSLAARLPKSTIVVIDGHDFGTALAAQIDVLRKNAALADAFKQVDAAAALLGGQDAVLGWIGDTDVVVTRDGTTVGAGLVVKPTDRTAAVRLLTGLRGFAQLGGASAGITVRDETYADQTITIVDLGDVSKLFGATTPTTLAVPMTGHLEIAYVVTDEVVAIGIGDTFVKQVIDAPTAGTLAADARYKALIERVGAKHAGAFWLDLTAVRELAESYATTMPGGLAAYDRDIKPYLLPFDAVGGAVVVGGDIDHVSIVVTFK